MVWINDCMLTVELDASGGLPRLVSYGEIPQRKPREPNKSDAKHHRIPKESKKSKHSDSKGRILK